MSKRMNAREFIAWKKEMYKNCLQKVNWENFEDGQSVEAYVKDKPCMAHKSPWMCIMNESKDLGKKLEILSTLNINDYEHMPRSKRAVHPIDWLAVYSVRHFLTKLDLDYNSVPALLRNYKILLKTMMRQNEARLPIPMHVIANLQADFFDYLRFNRVSKNNVITVAKEPLSFLLNALHMALSAGVNLEEKKCQLSTPSCSCDLPDSLTLFHIKPSVLYRFVKPHDGANTDPILFAKLAEFYEILFVHGNKPDRNWCIFVLQVVSFQKPELFKLGGMSLSLMDHEDWQHVQSKLNISHKRAVRSVPGNAEEEETKAGKLELLETYRGPKSLQDMCRKVLYDNVQDRRMVKYVGDLPLPTLVKQYLLFK